MCVGLIWLGLSCLTSLNWGATGWDCFLMNLVFTVVLGDFYVSSKLYAERPGVLTDWCYLFKSVLPTEVYGFLNWRSLGGENAKALEYGECGCWWDGLPAPGDTILSTSVISLRAVYIVLLNFILFCTLSLKVYSTMFFASDIYRPGTLLLWETEVLFDLYMKFYWLLGLILHGGGCWVDRSLPVDADN